MNIVEAIIQLNLARTEGEPDAEVVVMIDGHPFDFTIDADNESPVILTLANRDENGVVTSWIGNKALVSATLLDDEDMEVIEGKAEADRINSDLRLLDAYNELFELEHAFTANGGRGVEMAERIDQLRAILGEETSDPEQARCDICGRIPEDSPAGFADADWNPETGNHETCERMQEMYPNEAFAQGVSDTVEPESRAMKPHSIPVLSALDFRTEPIGVMTFDGIDAEAEEAGEPNAGNVTLWLSGTPEDPSSHVDGGQTWSLAFEMTWLDALGLAQRIRAEAKKAQKRA